MRFEAQPSSRCRTHGARLVLELVHDPTLDAAWEAWNGSGETWSALPIGERRKVASWVGAYMIFLDNAYYQVQLGTLPEAAFERWLLNMGNPQMHEFWSQSGDRFTAEFRGYVDSLRSQQNRER
jgi:hypothetical protein